MITKDHITTKYIEIYHKQPDVIVTSPGRINIIGEHTDYNEGFVLPTAIDKAVYVAIGKRSDDKIRLYAEDFKETFESSLTTLKPTENGWPNYILGVVNQMMESAYALSGFDLYIDGDVPLGAGLSSSAAVECATGYALKELFDLPLDRVDVAKIGQLAEHTFAGVKCGIMDQFASVLSKLNHVILLDCRDLSYKHIPLSLGDYTLLLLNTNVKHSLASTGYNQRRQSCEQGVAWVCEKYPEVKSLRDVSMDMLDELVKPKDGDVYIKCKYVVEENIRVIEVCDALAAQDMIKVGQVLNQAHQAMKEEYDITCPEIDYLADYVKQFPQVLGARLMGGGFGGCTINIVHVDFVDELIQRVKPDYEKQFGLELTPIAVVPSGGTDVMS